MTQFKGTEKYISSEELSSIVNIADHLQRPLLIRGEPGTGKTLLAKAVAESKNMRLVTWHVKSTSKAQEGLYVYDAVQRLNDSRFDDADVSDIKKYIKLGPLGQAFNAEERVVVLIDEVDKADIEFPNDLLHELDEMSFHIYETGETITAKQRPLVIITSNAEKELPDAFLRRCIFHYIEFPDKQQMEEIVRVHHPEVEKKLLAQCLAKFYMVRELPEVRKLPSTSELIDWISALEKGGIGRKEIERTLPFAGVLFKKEQDLSKVRY